MSGRLCFDAKMPSEILFRRHFSAFFQRYKYRAVFIRAQNRSIVVMPVAQNDAGKAVFMMNMLAVGMPVYQPFRIKGAYLLRGKGGIDIHNVGRLDLFSHFADTPDFGGKAGTPP